MVRTRGQSWEPRGSLTTDSKKQQASLLQGEKITFAHDANELGSGLSAIKLPDKNKAPGPQDPPGKELFHRKS